MRVTTLAAAQVFANLTQSLDGVARPATLVRFSGGRS